MNKAQEMIAWFEAQERRERIIWDDLPDGTVVQGPEIMDQGRWETFKRAVFRMDDGSHVEATWAEGSTEYQDSEPDMTLLHVEPYAEIVIKYRKVAKK